MANSRFTLSWESFGQNLCLGFSALQQNGEFVDMTLAADGHIVKVHQAVVALGSSYIKQLINNANCPHPVIFLNNVSFKTLRSILEYIYTGETQISNDEIKEFVEAGRNLHIKGIEDMSWENLTSSTLDIESQIEKSNKNVPKIQVSEESGDINNDINTTTRAVSETKPEDITDFDGHDTDSSFHNYEDESHNTPMLEPKTPDVIKKPVHMSQNDGITMKLGTGEDKGQPPSLIYTLSNVGSIHLILNRFEYYVDKCGNRHTGKIKTWRCVDATRLKCKAKVKTINGVVVKRCGVHNHPFHDKRILKKQKSGKVFFTLQEAEGHTNEPSSPVIKKLTSDVSERS